MKNVLIVGTVGHKTYTYMYLRRKSELFVCLIWSISFRIRIQESQINADPDPQLCLQGNQACDLV
jgi:hypothetical protein